MVIGSRFLGRVEPGALTPQVRFVNRLACLLMRLFWQVRHTDLGPFRAIRLEALRRLGMREAHCGWTVEMLVRAAMRGLRVTEVPVSCRRRIGTSKTWGTLRGTVGAGTGILGTIFRAALRGSRLVGPGSDVERLIVFTRYPEPGATKTRLIPVLGPVGTVALQRQMTTHALGTARAVAKCRGVGVEVRFVGADERRMREAFGAEFPYREQGRGDLGERMFRAFRTAFRHGAARTVIVGVDCPTLTSSILSQAFDALRSHEVVLGPDNRGGYYLIGARRSLPQLFEDIGWGTSGVFTRTMEIARRHGLSASVLPTLREVDRPEDLPVWDQAIRRRTR